MNMYIFKPLDDFISNLESEQLKAEREVLRAKTEIIELEKRNETISVILTVIFLVAVTFGSAILNSPKRLISSRLSSAGYSVNDLTVEKTDIKGVYKSSVAIESEDGQLIEMWEVKPISGFQTIWVAMPYPKQSISKNEIVDISFTQKEYEQLLSAAQQSGESIEDFI